MTISNISRTVVAISGVLLLSLVYFDGHMTERAVVKSHKALEGNPIVSVLLPHVSFKILRVFILLFMCGIALFSYFRSEVLSVWFLAFFWMLVDANNMYQLSWIRKSEKLKSNMITQEIGVEDLHEL